MDLERQRFELEKAQFQLEKDQHQLKIREDQYQLQLREDQHRLQIREDQIKAIQTQHQVQVRQDLLLIQEERTDLAAERLRHQHQVEKDRAELAAIKAQIESLYQSSNLMCPLNQFPSLLGDRLDDEVDRANHTLLPPPSSSLPEEPPASSSISLPPTSSSLPSSPSPSSSQLQESTSSVVYPPFLRTFERNINRKIDYCIGQYASKVVLLKKLVKDFLHQKNQWKSEREVMIADLEGRQRLLVQQQESVNKMAATYQIQSDTLGAKIYIAALSRCDLSSPHANKLFAFNTLDEFNRMYDEKIELIVRHHQELKNPSRPFPTLAIYSSNPYRGSMTSAEVLEVLLQSQEAFRSSRFYQWGISKR